MKKKIKKKIAAAIIVLVMLLAVAGMITGKRTGGAVQHRILTAEVKKGPLVISVEGSGTIQAVNPNLIKPLIKRQATITFLAPEGSHVTNGEVVVRLNTDDINRDIITKETALIDCNGKLEDAEAALEIQKMDNIANLAKAKQDREAAKQDLAQYCYSDAPVDKLNAELDVQTSESDLTQAEDVYKNTQDLSKEGFATKDELEKARMDLEKKQGALETTTMKLDGLERFGFPVKLSAKQGTLTSAEAGYEKASKQSETQLQNKDQAVRIAKMNRERAQKDLDMAKEDLKAYEIKAPVDGTVNYGDPDSGWRRSDIQVGGNLYPGQAVVNIPDMSVMKAVVPVLETDIFKVKAGQQATLTVEALSGKILHGEVKTVPTVADSTYGASAGMFKVVVSISDVKDMNPGLSCAVEIVTETIANAVFLPISAVFREGDRYFVYPARGGGKIKADVKAGKSSDEFVEILSGAEPGMKVLLSPLEQTEDKK